MAFVRPTAAELLQAIYRAHDAVNLSRNSMDHLEKLNRLAAVIQEQKVIWGDSPVAKIQPTHVKELQK